MTHGIQSHCHSTEGDEHTYFGVVVPNRDIGQINRPKYSSRNERLEATYDVKMLHYYQFQKKDLQ